MNLAQFGASSQGLHSSKGILEQVDTAMRTESFEQNIRHINDTVGLWLSHVFRLSSSSEESLLAGYFSLCYVMQESAQVYYPSC